MPPLSVTHNSTGTNLVFELRAVDEISFVIDPAFALAAWLVFACLGPPCLDAQSNASDKKSGPRTSDGLIVLYDFSAHAGNTIEDRSGVGEPLNLKIVDENTVDWIDGGIKVHGNSRIIGDGNTTKLVNLIGQTGEFTVEVWIEPESKQQTGPARIVTISRDANQRNFTLGQDNDRFEVRLRTTQTNANGIPATATPKRSLQAKISHVVYTRASGGRARIFIDGQQVTQSRIPGAVNNWDGNFKLTLANELNTGRPWKGSYYLVAIYNRELRIDEIKRNFRAGHLATSAVPIVDQSESTLLFEQQVAGLLANHCLECHEPATRQGGLDLSTRQTAFAGGDSGAAIVPNHPDQSLIWEQVASDEMPLDRTPLDKHQKAILKTWIASGADWSLATIDPVLYLSNPAKTQTWMRRLTVNEYIETVRASVGVDIAVEANQWLPPDLRADGFSNTAYNLNVDLKHVQAYAILAETIVGRIQVDQFASRFSDNQQLDEESLRRLIAEMGKWILRGPLSETEIQSYLTIAVAVENTGGDFREAVTLLLEAMLQSPRFIYRIEKQRGDGGMWPVGRYELASRISYLVWGDRPMKHCWKPPKTASCSIPPNSTSKLIVCWTTLERYRGPRSLSANG